MGQCETVNCNVAGQNVLGGNAENIPFSWRWYMVSSSKQYIAVNDTTKLQFICKQ
jgi:hypothetical protein